MLKPLSIITGIWWLDVGVSIISYGFGGYALVNFWYPHVSIMLMPWHRTMVLLDRKLTIKLNKALDAAMLMPTQTDKEKRNVDFAKQKALNALHRELEKANGHYVNPPSIDAFVYVTEDRRLNEKE